MSAPPTPPFVKLPAEILEITIKYSSHQCLKNLSLVSSHFPTSAQKLLFKKLVLGLSLRLFANFLSVSSSPRLRNYVKSIEYLGRVDDTRRSYVNSAEDLGGLADTPEYDSEVPVQTYLYTFSDWSKWNAGKNFELQFKKERQEIEAFDDPSQRVVYHANWRDPYGFEYLVHEDNAKKLLGSQLTNFINISDLLFASRPPPMMSRLTLLYGYSCRHTQNQARLVSFRVSISHTKKLKTGLQDYPSSRRSWINR